MFDILDRPLVWIAVKWPGLQQLDEGDVASVVTHEVEVQVEIIDRAEFEKWLALNAADAAEDGRNEAAELEIFRTVAKGWRKIKANGKALEFNDENIAQLLRYPGFATAFGAHYMRAWQGQAETRSGNSESSPANGRAGGATGATTKAVNPTS